VNSNQGGRGKNGSLILKSMKSNKSRIFIVLLLVMLALTCSLIFTGLAIRYVSPSFSGVVLDDYTGEPIEGATVQVTWIAIRRTGNEHNPDMMDICRVTTTTDKYGVYTIPAWANNVSTEWELYGAGWVNADNPQCSVSIPKNKTTNHLEQIQLPATHGLAIWTKKLKPPEWAISEGEAQERENPNAVPKVNQEVLSNSLTYCVIYGDKVENGRLIDTTDFPKVGYLRPKPEVIITHIQSFSTNVTKDLLYDNWHVIGIPEDQRWASGFSITLFQADAKKVAELERKCIRSRNLIFMLDNKPLAETYMAKDAGSADSIPIPTEPQTLYLPLRNRQDIQEINDALKKLVRSK
jgi:hypothetical protein